MHPAARRRRQPAAARAAPIRSSVMSRRFLLLASLVMVMLASSSCSGASQRTDDQVGHQNYVDGGTYTMSIDDDLAPFDPYRHFSPVTYFAYDSLVNLRPKGTFVSGLAQAWKVGS